jgi:hypothetical protein
MPHNHKSTTNPERFIHFRPPQGINEKYSAATIFLRKEADNIWRASVALCWKLDQFCRETGRKNARRHYFLKKPSSIRELGEHFNMHKAIQFAIEKANESI